MLDPALIITGIINLTSTHTNSPPGQQDQALPNTATVNGGWWFLLIGELNGFNLTKPWFVAISPYVFLKSLK